MNESLVFQLQEFPAHLGLGASVEREPRFTGSEWYREYSERHAADGGEGRLVSMHSFAASWDSWEMHPGGSELVVCTAGRMTLHQELNGRRLTIALSAGEAVINPPGAWHTADVEEPCTVLFITAGLGTQIRPR